MSLLDMHMQQYSCLLAWLIRQGDLSAATASRLSDPTNGIHSRLVGSASKAVHLRDCLLVKWSGTAEPRLPFDVRLRSDPSRRAWSHSSYIEVASTFAIRPFAKPSFRRSRSATRKIYYHNLD